MKGRAASLLVAHWCIIAAHPCTAQQLRKETLIELQTAKAVSDLSIVSPAPISERRGLFQRRGKADAFIGATGKRLLQRRD